MASRPPKTKAKTQYLVPGAKAKRRQKPSSFSKLPAEMIYEILSVLYELDDKPLTALCRFMRVCKRFHETALSAHALWARGVLAPAITRARGDASIEFAVASRITTIVERSKHALLTLRTPRPLAGRRSKPTLWALLPTLLLKARNISVELTTVDATVDFLGLLMQSNVHHLESLSVSSPACLSLIDLHAFTTLCTRKATSLGLSIQSLRQLTLKNSIPCCFSLPGLTSLSIRLTDIPYTALPSLASVLDHLRPMCHLTHLALHDCISQSNVLSNVKSVNLTRLACLELTCPPYQCTALLQYLHVPPRTVITWQESWPLFRPRREDPAVVSDMLEVLRKVLDIDGRARKQFIAHLDFQTDIPEAYVPSDWRSEDWCGDVEQHRVRTPNTVFSLHNNVATENEFDLCTENGSKDNLIVQLRFRGDLGDFPYTHLPELVCPSRIDSLALTMVGFVPCGYVRWHAKDILHPFSAITRLGLFSLTTPDTLAAVVSASMDPSATPLLCTLFIREFGHPCRTRWMSSPAVVALCEALDARRRSGCERAVNIRLGTIMNIHGEPFMSRYMRGTRIGSGKRLNDLWDLLAQAGRGP